MQTPESRRSIYQSITHREHTPFLASLSHTHLHTLNSLSSVTDIQTDGHRAVYQCSRGDVAFGTGDYAVSRAVCLGLCRKTQSALLVLGNNGEKVPSAGYKVGGYCAREKKKTV